MIEYGIKNRVKFLSFNLLRSCFDSGRKLFYITMFCLLAAIIVFMFLGSWSPLFITIGVLLVNCVSFLLYSAKI